MYDLIMKMDKDEYIQLLIDYSRMTETEAEQYADMFEW